MRRVGDAGRSPGSGAPARHPVLLRDLAATSLPPVAAATVATVSVVITCFNYERFLREAVESALGQDGVTVDVIVVDDASTDGSLSLARRLADADGRVTVLANPENRGAVETFNRGLAAATGEFIVRLDADDLLTPGSLLRAVAVMQAQPAVGLVYGHPLHFSGETLPEPRLTPDRWVLWRGRDWLAARCVDGTNVITSPEVVMRGSVVAQVGGQRPLAHTHDMEMWLRIAAHSDVVYIGGVDQAWHREHPASLSKAAAQPLVILGEIRDAFDTLFADLADTDGNRSLHAAARNAVATEALVQGRRMLDRGEGRVQTASFLEFAEECDPAITGSTSWRTLHRRLSHGARSPLVARLRGVLPRAGRQIRRRIRTARWDRFGVYERVRFESGGHR